MKTKTNVFRVLIMSLVLLSMSSALQAQDFTVLTDYTGGTTPAFMPPNIAAARNSMTCIKEDDMLKCVFSNEKSAFFRSQALNTYGIDTKVDTFLNVSLRNNTKSLQFRIYYSTTAAFAGTKMQGFDIDSSSNEFVKYSFNITKATYRDLGALKFMRLQMEHADSLSASNPGTKGQTFDIDSIGLSSEPWVQESEGEGVATLLMPVREEVALNAYVVSGTQTLNVEYGNDIKTAQILTISGQMVKEVSGSAKSMQIDLSSQNPGIYLVKVYGVDNECTVSKFVKQ